MMSLYFFNAWSCHIGNFTCGLDSGDLTVVERDIGIGGQSVLGVEEEQVCEKSKNWRNLVSDQQKLGLNLPMGSESDRCAMYDG